MTRLWPQGDPIQVTLDERGTPHTIVWRQRRHIVQEIADSWHIDVDWWRGRIWREYYKLTTQSGLLVIIYHQVSSQEWFLQRLYD